MVLPLRLIPTACALALATASFVSCTSTIPDAAQMDVYMQQSRVIAQPQYDELEQLRASGQVSQAEYQARKASLDHRVAKKADDMALSRHMLAQSEAKAHDIPTPDRPIPLAPPVMGMAQDTMYRPAAQQFGQQAGASNTQSSVNRTSRFNQYAQPGTIYDEQQ